MELETKKCSKCKKDKPLTDFYNSKAFGKTYQCKDCDKEYRLKRESGEIEPIRRSKLEEIGKMIELPNGLFRLKKQYRNTFANYYYKKVKCSECGKELLRLTSNNTIHSFCPECVTGKAKFYYTLDKKIKTSGHILCYAPNHPNARKNYVAEHRLIVEKRIGRYLTEEEKVHHKNCIKDDNYDSNLWLTDSSGHTKAHNSLMQCVKPLMDAGLLIFNDITGKYEANIHRSGSRK